MLDLLIYEMRWNGLVITFHVEHKSARSQSVVSAELKNIEGERVSITEEHMDNICRLMDVGYLDIPCVDKYVIPFPGGW